MIKEISIENFKSIKEKVVISTVADARSRYLSCNYEDTAEKPILKSIGMFGANNSGKSTIASALKFIKTILLGEKPIGLYHNILSKNPIISMSVEFSYGGSWFLYGFKYNEDDASFVNEYMKLLVYRQNHTKREELIFERELGIAHFKSLSDKPVMAEVNLRKEESFVQGYSRINNGNKRISNYIRKLKMLPDLIEIVSMEKIGLDETIKVLKKNDPKEKAQLLEFIKSTDPSITDFYLDKDEGNNAESSLKTEYGDVSVPSTLYDSSGLRKIEALGGYIINSLKQGKILVIDQLDNGLHFKLTRAIVSLFNNMANKRSQLFFITHDVTLLDTKYLLRKDQIYFVFKEENQTVFKRLSDFKAVDGIRKDSDVLKRYKNNVFGLLPEPKFTNTILTLINDEELNKDAD